MTSKTFRHLWLVEKDAMISLPGLRRSTEPHAKIDKTHVHQGISVICHRDMMMGIAQCLK